jgi:hypothetical protein
VRASLVLLLLPATGLLTACGGSGGHGASPKPAQSQPELTQPAEPHVIDIHHGRHVHCPATLHAEQVACSAIPTMPWMFTAAARSAVDPRQVDRLVSEVIAHPKKPLAWTCVGRSSADDADDDDAGGVTIALDGVPPAHFECADVRYLVWAVIDHPPGAPTATNG